jgi:hypothetical protein
MIGMRSIIRPRFWVDHSAAPGTGSADADRIYRIDEQFARHDIESHGFRMIATTDVLRHPEDKRDPITYKGPMLGKTDRFVLVFTKNRWRSGAGPPGPQRRVPGSPAGRALKVRCEAHQHVILILPANQLGTDRQSW